MNDRFKLPLAPPEWLAPYRITLPALERQAGMPEGFLRQEKITVTTAQLLALWRALGEMSSNPDIGLKMSGESQFELFNPSAIAALCSRSFHDALQRIDRFKQLTCPQEIRVQTTRDEACVEVLFIHAQEAIPDVLSDFCLGWIMGVSRRGTGGRLKPLRIELMRSPGNRELLESHFDCRVQFKARRDALIFHKRDLDMPFVTHNDDLLQAVGTRLESELQERQTRSDVGQMVKRSLRRSIAGQQPTLHHTARDLGLSVRTLQRRLTESSQTFQQLVEETRGEMARHYLKNSGIELNEIAFLLGYGDANSFFRAFQRWEAASPGEWRARHSLAEGVPHRAWFVRGNPAQDRVNPAKSRF